MHGQPELLQVVDALGRRAASRADWTAGKKVAINTAIMAMTTNNSMSVKARVLDACMNRPFPVKTSFGDSLLLRRTGQALPWPGFWAGIGGQFAHSAFASRGSDAYRQPRRESPVVERYQQDRRRPWQGGMDRNPSPGPDPMAIGSNGRLNRRGLAPSRQIPLDFLLVSALDANASVSQPRADRAVRSPQRATRDDAKGRGTLRRTPRLP